MKLTTLSRTKLWRDEKAGKFPKHIELGSRKVYLESEVIAWMESQPRGSSKATKARSAKATAGRRNLKPKLRVIGRRGPFTVIAPPKPDTRLLALLPSPPRRVGVAVDGDWLPKFDG